MNQPEHLLEVVITRLGDKYTVSTPNGNFSVTSRSPLDAVMNWGFHLRQAIKRYRNGEITLEYFCTRLGIDQETACCIIDTQEIIELSDERLKLNRLLEDG